MNTMTNAELAEAIRFATEQCAKCSADMRSEWRIHLAVLLKEQVTRAYRRAA